MSWPTENEGKIRCIGFPEKYLPAIMNAVDNKIVKWGKSDLFMSMGTAQFDWVDCTWELTEMQECVESIQLIKGKPTDEDLTAAVLKGKIEAS
jgi:hypothetical protein